MGIVEALVFFAIPVKVMAAAILLSIVANRLVEGLVKPLYKKRGWDSFTILYVSWGFAALIVGLGEINLFMDVFPVMIWGLIPGRIIGIALSALVAGGGANFIHDIFDKKKKDPP